jgi:hypothetical protein
MSYCSYRITILQLPGLAGTPSTGYLHSTVALRWYSLSPDSQASWLPPQTMECNGEHSPSKNTTLHPAMSQGLLDAASNSLFKAFVIQFLQIVVGTISARRIIFISQFLGCSFLQALHQATGLHSAFLHYQARRFYWNCS